MQTISRITVLFGAPALLMAVVSLAAWLALGSAHNDFGPMRLAPLPPPPVADPSGAAAAPPPNQIEQMSPAEAELKNALLPFSRSGLGVAAAYRPMPGLMATAVECLTQAVYYEAAREPDAGQRAVAQVVLNRVASTPFPKTICGVVQQGAGRPGCQFTFMCDGSLSRAPDPALWIKARSVAEAALNGYVEPSVGDATHYHADYVFPTWAPEMVKLTKIGRHIFYHWRGAVLASAPDEAAGSAADVSEVPSSPLLPSASLAPSEAPSAVSPGADGSALGEQAQARVAAPQIVQSDSLAPAASQAPLTPAPPPRRSNEAAPHRAMPERSLVSGQP